MAIYSWGLLCLVMTWKIWCPEVVFFFSFFNLGVSWSLFAQMPFIQSLCETYWGLRSVRSALQESDPLIYRPLIRLALWRFYQANDEISPFCLSSVGPALPSPGKPCISALSLTGPLHHHTLHSSYDAVHGQHTFALHCHWGSTTGLFQPGAHCGLNISWTVSLLSLHYALLT